MRRILFLLATITSALAWAQAPAGVPPASRAGTEADSAETAATPASESSAASDVFKPASEANSGSAAASISASGSTTVANELGPSTRPYLVRAGIDFSTRVVSSVTPAQDRGLSYYGQGEYRLIPRGSVFLRMGFNQVFVARADHPAFLLQDTVLGFKWAQGIESAMLPALTFLHSARVYLPTSKVSRNTGLYVAPELRTQVTLEPLSRLTTGLELRAQYRFHRYAERGDLSEGLNTRTQLMAHPFAAYQLAQFGRFGTLEVGADLFYSWKTLYGSRETYVLPDPGSTAPASEPAPLQSNLGWDAYLSYWPVKQFALTASLLQNAPVLRDGIVNQDAFFDRDETQLVFGVYAQY